MIKDMIADALDANRTKAVKAVSTVLSYIVAGILVGGVLAWGAYILRHLDREAVGEKHIATADERDRFMNAIPCSGDGEVCRVQTMLYRDAVRQFALRDDIKLRELRSASERLKAETLQQALNSVRTSGPTRP